MASSEPGPGMGPVLFRVCWLTMLALDWIPGYCRYYLVKQPDPSPAGWYPRFGDFERHWEWRWHANWGMRLVIRLGLIDEFADECDRRHREENPSSAS